MCINDRLIFLCVATRHTHESYTVTVSGPKNNDESTNGVPQFSGFHVSQVMTMTNRAQTPWLRRQPPASSPRTAAASSPTK